MRPMSCGKNTAGPQPLLADNPKAEQEAALAGLAQSRSPAAPKSIPLLTRPLGLEGWTELEPVVLAALASEDPLLLVGKHGCAKSFLLERLARALRLEYRFYNASLISFDDLVGIPVPDEAQEHLRYIGTPTAIWPAEVVFIDELNRAKPELQNKVFPIIHERRVQGLKLEKLRYRWAAMNPPPDPEGDLEEAGNIGAEPLDPALADRFAFLIEVPAWQDLGEAEKKRVLTDQYQGAHDFSASPVELVADTRHLYLAFQQQPPPGLCDYLIGLEKLLGKAGFYLSTRRLSTLHRNILAVQAARVTLWLRNNPGCGVESVDWEGSALLAIRHGLPQLAERGKLDQAAILAAHRQAWRVAGLGANDPWRELLQISDPLERFVRAHRLGVRVGDCDLGQLILDAVTSQKNPSSRITVALAAYLAVYRDHQIPGTVLETLSGEIQRVIHPGSRSESVWGAQLSDSREVSRICSVLDPKNPRDGYTRNLLNGLGPAQFEDTTPDAVAELFRNLWGRLQISIPSEPLAGKERGQ
jgi:MoxR-like ATPase